VAKEGIVIRRSLYLRDPIRNGDGPFCPRCDCQIVVIAGHFICSCGYDDEAWTEDLARQDALEEASARG
jgi:hypothetical protein